MRRLITVLAFILITLTGFCQGTIGTKVTSSVVPNDSLDDISTHGEYFGAGGYRTVSTIIERDAIYDSRRVEGMLVYVLQDSIMYQLRGGVTNDFWKPVILRSLVVLDNLTTRGSSTFPFRVVTTDSLSRLLVSNKGLIITGRGHDTVVNADALALIGSFSSARGVNTVAVGHQVRTKTDSSMVMGYWIVDTALDNTVTIGSGKAGKPLSPVRENALHLGANDSLPAIIVRNDTVWIENVLLVNGSEVGSGNGGADAGSGLTMDGSSINLGGTITENVELLGDDEKYFSIGESDGNKPSLFSVSTSWNQDHNSDYDWERSVDIRGDYDVWIESRHGYIDIVSDIELDLVGSEVHLMNKNETASFSIGNWGGINGSPYSLFSADSMPLIYQGDYSNNMTRNDHIPSLGKVKSLISDSIASLDVGSSYTFNYGLTESEGIVNLGGEGNWQPLEIGTETSPYDHIDINASDVGMISLNSSQVSINGSVAASQTIEYTSDVSASFHDLSIVNRKAVSEMIEDSISQFKSEENLIYREKITFSNTEILSGTYKTLAMPGSSGFDVIVPLYYIIKSSISEAYTGTTMRLQEQSGNIIYQGSDIFIGSETKKSIVDDVDLIQNYPLRIRAINVNAGGDEINQISVYVYYQLWDIRN